MAVWFLDLIAVCVFGFGRLCLVLVCMFVWCFVCSYCWLGQCLVWLWCGYFVGLLFCG